MLTVLMKYIWFLVFVLVVGGGIWWARSGQKPVATVPESTETQNSDPLLSEEKKDEKSVITTSNKKTINGMTIETTKEGEGEAITNGKTAVVDYVGKLADGTVFDASARHGQPFAFPLGAGMVIKGWEQGVLGMKVGETRILTIPPELGYGATGAGGVIPPNATLIFEVTLQAIK